MPIVLLGSTQTRTYELPASSVISKVRIITQDQDSDEYRNADSEILGWLNDAINTVLSIIPGLFVQEIEHTCTPGVKQTTSEARAIRVNDVIGVPVCDIKSLTLFAPGWQQAAQGAIQNWMPVDNSPLSFYTYPPSVEGATIQISAVISPTPLVSTDDLIPLPESFEPALVEYCAGMTQVKEDESIDFQRQQALMNSFIARVSGQQPKE
jgi:hypothetical protein